MLDLLSVSIAVTVFAIAESCLNTCLNTLYDALLTISLTSHTVANQDSIAHLVAFSTTSDISLRYFEYVFKS